MRQRESSPIATTWRQPASAPGRVDERGLVGLSDGGEMAAGRRGRFDRGLHGRRRAIGLTLAVEERHLADRRSDRRVLGSRSERVATTERGPERRDPAGVDAAAAAYAIAARQSSSLHAGSTWSGSPLLSPKPR